MLARVSATHAMAPPTGNCGMHLRIFCDLAPTVEVIELQPDAEVYIQVA